MSEIIIGVDGTERGEDAVVFGRQFAAFAGARNVLVNVFPFDDISGRATSIAYRETLREASEEVLSTSDDQRIRESTYFLTAEIQVVDGHTGKAVVKSERVTER